MPYCVNIFNMSISKFLINKKLAKNEKQANIIMILIIGACLLFVILQNIGGTSNQNSELTPEEIELLQQEDFDSNNFPFE